MSRTGNVTLITLSLLLALVMSTPIEETPKESIDSKDLDYASEDKDPNEDEDGRNIIIPTANGGLGVTFGFLDPTAITNFFTLGLGTGLTGLTGIGLPLLWGIILTLGVAAAITLAIVLPISIGVGVYKKLVEDETGFSGSGSYGGTSYGASAPSTYSAPSYSVPQTYVAPSYGGFSQDQSSYSIHRSLEEAAKKYLDTNEE